MGKFEEAAARKGLPARDLKNASIANLWIFAWATSLVVISYLSKYDWYSSNLIIAIGLMIHAGIGIGMILAFRLFLTEADELQRKVQLDALALSVGVTIVVFSSSSLLAKAGVLPELGGTGLIVVMSFGYCAGLLLGWRRYR